MVHIAILGYGVVGSGIVKVLNRNRVRIEKKAGQAIIVKHVLDKREFPGDSIVEPLLTNDYEDILNDSEVQIIAEVMGGVEPAYTYVKQALMRGKSVCTSNKELVIKHGAELLALAKERSLNFLFEASVGGGIPIVRPMNLALTTDEVMAVSGILNGTSNYILTRMRFGKSYTEALEEARRMGFAEADPTADIQGFDTCRKLAILLSLATGKQVDYDDIYTEGITNIGMADFAFANAFGSTVKLLADGRISESSVEAIVAPFLIHREEPLSAVADEFNGVVVQAKVTDNVMFYGRGAGQLPTAGAVVSDIVDIVKHLKTHIMHTWSTEKMPVLPLSGYIKKKMVRISCEYDGKIPETLREITGDALIIEMPEIPEYRGMLAWFTPPETEQETANMLERLKAVPGFIRVEQVLRVYEPLKEKV